MVFLTSFIIAVLFSLILLSSIGRKKDASLLPIIVFFMVLFFAGIAGGFWIVPFGPVLWGVSWLPIFLVILFVTLMVAIPPPHRPKAKASNTDPEASATFAAIGFFTWMLLLLLIFAAIAGIYRAT
jgi:hypothetical protein